MNNLNPLDSPSPTSGQGQGQVHGKEYQHQHQSQSMTDTPRGERGSGHFYSTFRPTLRSSLSLSSSPSNQNQNQNLIGNSNSNTNSMNDERTAKRRSIFTVSSILPPTSTKNFNNELINFVAQVNSLTNDLNEGNKNTLNSSSSNYDKTNSCNGYGYNNGTNYCSFSNNSNNESEDQEKDMDNNNMHTSGRPSNLDFQYRARSRSGSRSRSRSTSGSRNRSSTEPRHVHVSLPIGRECSNSKLNNLNANLSKGCGESENDHGHDMRSSVSSLPLYCPSTLSPARLSFPTPPCSPYNGDGQSSSFSENRDRDRSPSRSRKNCHRRHGNNLSFTNSASCHKLELDTEDNEDDQVQERGRERDRPYCRSGGYGNVNTFQKGQRHNSLENLYHPKNHRSRSSWKASRSGDGSLKKSKSRRNVSWKKEEFCPDAENTALLEEKKNTLACKATTAFAMGAVRRLSIKVTKIQEQHKLKVQESAARLILHSLLLNSWRQCRRQNEKMMKENQMQLRTVENMCLQLRVIRQMHREEKEKSQSRGLEASTMSIQLSTLQRDKEQAQTELKRIENELNGCKALVDSVEKKNTELKQNKTELQKAVALLQQEKQEEIKKVAKLEMEQIRTQDTMKEMKQQIHEITRQRAKWQEEARGKDSEIISFKSDIAFRDKHLNQIQTSYQELQRKLIHYEESRQKIRQEEQKLKDQLGKSLDEIQRLSEKLGESTHAIEKQTQLTGDMQKIVEKKNLEIKEMRENLGLYLREGIERRRRWANAFHYLVFPMDMLRLLFDLPCDKFKYAVDLGEINGSSSCLSKMSF